MKKLSTRDFVGLSMLVAVVIVLGYLSIPLAPGLALTFNMIPVAIAAIVYGPVGGLIIGAAFGMVSFLQCFGIFGPLSLMGEATLAISPLGTIAHRFIPRMLDGFLLGLIYKGMKRLSNDYVSCAVTGLAAALLNTIFFMSALVLIFGGSEYMQGKMAGMSPMGFILASIGAQAAIEMVTSTVLTGAIGVALKKAKVIQ